MTLSPRQKLFGAAGLALTAPLVAAMQGASASNVARVVLGLAAVAGIARKLRHYGRQGYVVFDTPSLQAALQGEWAALDSPLGVVLDPAGANTPLRLPPTPPLEP